MSLYKPDLVSHAKLDSIEKSINPIEDSVESKNRNNFSPQRKSKSPAKRGRNQ